MNKTLKYIVFCLAVAVMVGVFAMRVDREDTDAKAMPHIDAASNFEGTVDISQLKGDYVLVNFWDSHNAVSRIAAGEYDRMLKTHPDMPVKLLSVNTDDDRPLYQEIVNHDKLDPSTQFHISDTRKGKHAPAFHATDGYASYLLGPDGKTVAVNPSVEQVERIVAGNK